MRIPKYSRTSVRGRLLVAFLLPFLLIPEASLAWSRQGHEIVGELAERQLKPETRARALALLAGEPVPTLAGVSAWADELRDNDPDLGKRSFRWHFVNFPRGQCRYEAARDCANGECVMGAIERQAALLKDRSQPIETRQQALKFLVHFVGDVHQPLHAAWGEDKGGNDFQVSLDGEGSNLHRVWDRAIIESAGLGPAAYADRLLSRARGEGTGKDGSSRPGGPVDWALESCALADAQGFYPASRKIGDDYLERHRPTVERRLTEAGTRLAAMIEVALGASD
jgi:hypothetical protein